MIDLAERCVTALKEHAQAAFTAQLAGMPPEAQKIVQHDRTRYFEEVERELVKVLRPVQDLVEGLETRGYKRDGELESVCWCNLKGPRDHTGLCRFLFYCFDELGGS